MLGIKELMSDPLKKLKTWSKVPGLTFGGEMVWKELFLSSKKLNLVSDRSENKSS